MASLAGTTAVILAGGLGTRLRSAIDDRPKVLAPVRGRPFLSYLLDQLEAAGVQEVALCVGYLGAQIERSFGTSYRGLRLAYSWEASPLGTGGALRNAASLLHSDTVLVANGDSYCDADLQALLDRHRQWRAAATLLLAQVPRAGRYGRVIVDRNGRIESFEEKSGESPGVINAGIYLIGCGLLETLPANRAISLEREVFPHWVGRGLYGYASEGRFLDIGTPDAYAAADEFFFRAEETHSRNT